VKTTKWSHAMRVEMLHVITQLLLPSQTDLRLDRVVADDQSQTLMIGGDLHAGGTRMPTLCGDDAPGA